MKNDFIENEFSRKNVLLLLEQGSKFEFNFLNLDIKIRYISCTRVY